MEGIQVVVDTDEEDGIEKIQVYLNDMGRNQHIDFYQQLAALEIRPDTLEPCASRLFGEQWGAMRREKRLVEQLSTTTPHPATKTPRL